MILDSLKNADRYKTIHPLFEKAFSYLQDVDVKTLKEGRNEIQGDDIFALYQKYETQDDKDKYGEAHKKFIDIQYIISGKEEMGFTNSSELQIRTPYNPDRDLVFYEKTEQTNLIVGEGEFALFFAEEYHNPCLHHGKEGDRNIEKIVIKIKA